jgi:uncharacterized membrane protein YeiB
MSTPVAERAVGPDVTRALAMVGVITMNYIGYSILLGAPRRSGALARFFDPWEGPVATRFAATFVLVAGIGVAFMAQTARRRQLRLRLLSRGVVLLIFGLAFDVIWAGAILPYYGMLFIVAVVIAIWPRWAIAVLGIISALVAWVLQQWVVRETLAQQPPRWLTDPASWSIEGLVLNTWVNGTHPLLPWLAFFCTGILIGRMMLDGYWRTGGRRLAGVVGLVMWLGAGLLSWAIGEDTGQPGRWATHPFDRGLLYTLSALGTALLALALIDAVASRWRQHRIVGWLQTAGQVSLTIYVVHALVFNLAANWTGVLVPSSVEAAMVFAACVVLVSVPVAVWWARRFGRGPCEAIYRRITL